MGRLLRRPNLTDGKCRISSGFHVQNRCIRYVGDDSSADAAIKAKAASADWQFHYKRADALFARRHIKDMGNGSICMRIM